MTNTVRTTLLMVVENHPSDEELLPAEKMEEYNHKIEELAKERLFRDADAVPICDVDIEVERE